MEDIDGKVGKLLITITTALPWSTGIESRKYLSVWWGDLYPQMAMDVKPTTTGATCRRPSERMPAWRFSPAPFQGDFFLTSRAIHLVADESSDSWISFR